MLSPRRNKEERGHTRALFVQMQVPHGHLFFDLVGIGLTMMGYKHGEDFGVPGEEMNVAEKDRKKLAKQIETPEFQAKAIEFLSGLTIKELYNSHLDTQFIPFAPTLEFLEGQKAEAGGMKVVTQIREIPYMRIDGFDAAIAKEKEELDKRAAAAAMATGGNDAVKTDTSHPARRINRKRRS